jgi:hypothetical protein
MESTEVKHLKALVHLGLVLAPALELKQSNSKFRNVLLGLAMGWHLNAAYYHLFIEQDEEPKKYARKPRKRPKSPSAH